MSGPANLTDAAIQRDKMATLGLLAAGLAHEINNPVGYIASNMGSLSRSVSALIDLINAVPQFLPEDQAELWRQRCAEVRWDFLREDLPELIDETSRGADQLRRLVTDLKMFSRAGADSEPCSVDECITAALTVLSHQFRHGVELQQDLASSGQRELVRAQVIQAITNILHNAVQAVSGKGRLKLTSGVNELGHAVITIEDNGPGIDPCIADTLFEPFTTTKASSAGTGLGLPIARHIVEHHGGSLAVDESPDLSGARFTITIKGVSHA